MAAVVPLPATQARVLLVDDQPHNLFALEAILEPLDIELVTAASGEEALRALLRTEFALVLIDVNMPGLDGIQTTHLIKQRAATRHVPIIFLTADDNREQILRGYAAGGADYIVKPFEPEVLTSKVSVFVDLWELRRSAEDLTRRALHDPLTGLPNRTLFLDRLELALTRLERHPGHVAVLFFDLDRFKSVNDTLGHDAGDALLVEITSRLRATLRPEDTLARFAGDEFTILCEGLEEETAAIAIADRVSAALTEPFSFAGRRVPVSASIGVAIAGPSASADAVLAEADAAMYRAKHGGRSQAVLFDEGLRRRISRRQSDETDLRRAIGRDELSLHYQPQLRVDTGTPIGYEALVRWWHPTRGVIAPDAFVPLAEQSDLMCDLGAWVLDEACRQAAHWNAVLGGDGPSISVNLSPRQLDCRDFVDTVAGTIDRHGLPASQITLEITENVLVEGEAGIVALRALKAAGHAIAIDDFGTGYSSIGYLRKLPVDILKVDRSFVTGLGEDAASATILGAIVDLAHGLGLAAIAEGVETEGQLAVLRTIGVDAAQGYYLGAPRPALGIDQELRRGRSARTRSARSTAAKR